MTVSSRTKSPSTLFYRPRIMLGNSSFCSIRCVLAEWDEHGLAAFALRESTLMKTGTNMWTSTRGIPMLSSQNPTAQLRFYGVNQEWDFVGRLFACRIIIAPIISHGFPPVEFQRGEVYKPDRRIANYLLLTTRDYSNPFSGPVAQRFASWCVITALRVFVGQSIPTSHST